MATKTSGATVSYNSNPKYLVAGGITRVFTHLETLTLSAGDVVRLEGARIPHGAVIHHVRVGGKTMDGTATLIPQIEVGTTTTGLGSLTISVAGRYPTAVVGPTTAGEACAIPFTVSVSDDAAVRYGIMKVQAQGTSASVSTSANIVLVVEYTMDA